MRLVWDTSGRVSAWVADQIPHMRGGAGFGPAVSAAVFGEDGARLLGAAVFHDYQPRLKSIQISAASSTRRWLSDAILLEIFSYPFHQLGCQRITAITAKRSAGARAFLEDFGFKREGVARHGMGDDDAMLYGLLRREWLKSRWSKAACPALSEAGAPVQSQPEATATPA